MSRTITNVTRRVFPNEGESFIEVGSWTEDLDFVELRTLRGKFSEEYFGRISVALTPDAAEELGRALIASASDVRGAK